VGEDIGPAEYGETSCSGDVVLQHWRGGADNGGSKLEDDVPAVVTTMGW